MNYAIGFFFALVTGILLAAIARHFDVDFANSPCYQPVVIMAYFAGYMMRYIIEEQK